MPERESTSLTRYVDKDDGQSGVRVGTPTTVASVVAGRTYYRRLFASRDMLVVGQSHVLTTAAGADDACDGGIYNAAGFKQCSSGATLGRLNGALGRKVLTYTTPYRILAGQVYFAALSIITPLGGTAAGVSCQGFGDVNNYAHFGATFPQAEGAITELTHPLPTTMVPAYSQISSFPVIALLEA